jgi:hypothetical protein
MYKYIMVAEEGIALPLTFPISNPLHVQTVGQLNA